MRRWGAVAAATFFPLAAILHHAVFYRPQCMLNPFGPDYLPAVVVHWLSSDPSPWIAAAGAVLLWKLGRGARVQATTLAFVIAFIPLTLWIWDIPFTGRIVCGMFHDGRIGIRTRYVYLACALLWPLVFLALRPRARTHP